MKINQQKKYAPKLATMTGFFLCLLMTVSLPLMAQDFTVQAAKSYRSADNLYFSATLDYQLHPEAYSILERGLPIRVVFELELSKTRRYWLDKTLLEKEYVYVLQSDPITETYELKRLDTDFTLKFPDINSAVESLRYLSNLYVAEYSVLNNIDNAQARIRMNLDVRNFPEPLQYLSQFWGDWVQTSEWFYWALTIKPSDTVSTDNTAGTETQLAIETAAEGEVEVLEDVEVNSEIPATQDRQAEDLSEQGEPSASIEQVANQADTIQEPLGEKDNKDSETYLQEQKTNDSLLEEGTDDER